MKTCLVVDDSRVIRTVSRHLVEALGFTVSEAPDGAEALRQCRDGMPDLVLLDWNMPVMNGIQFLAALRQLGARGHTKVVFCTTERDVPHIRAGIAAGADEYLIKPFDSATLEEKLRRIGMIS